MEELLKERVIKMAEILVNNKSTVREVAKVVRYSKSTVHKDLTERLIKIDRELYQKVREQLDYNKSIRHLRGGMSTKLRYSKHPDSIQMMKILS